MKSQNILLREVAIEICVCICICTCITDIFCIHIMIMICRYMLLLWLSRFSRDSVRPHGRQPTRLSRPWDSPGKNTGVACHCLLQCMKVKRGSEVAQSCPTLSDPMGYSLPGTSVHGIFQARVLEWDTISCSVDIWENRNNCYNWVTHCLYSVSYMYPTLHQALHKNSLSTRS